MTDLLRFLTSVHPYDALEPVALEALVPHFQLLTYAAGDEIYPLGQTLPGLFLIRTGEVEVFDDHNILISVLGPRNSFGERGLLRDGTALTSAVAKTDSEVLILPAAAFRDLVHEDQIVARFFDRSRTSSAPANDLASMQVADLMATSPLTCTPQTSVQQAAERMSEARVSSICVTHGGDLLGIATTRDMTGKVVARALAPDTHISGIMTQKPVTLPPSAIGSDVLHLMMEKRISHIPICKGPDLVGIVTKTDLARVQAMSSAEFVGDIAKATSAEEMADVTAIIPQLLAQLVATGRRHDVVTRLVTDLADTATRRLLALAEDRFGPAPAPFLWAACGSQGRQEQTGVSDQDNCLILSDDARKEDMPYFEKLAKFVCDGLDTCGYVYCPGDMMATNPRWRQPVRVWRGYFDGWIAKPSPEAQMLASVMFDLRAIGGDVDLLEDLQSRTLEAAARNSIFVSHMIANSLKHAPPLGLLRGLATIRSGEHRNQIDLKHNGVVPVVDLGRIYALQARLAPVNTRSRLEAAIAAGALSSSGGQDLLDAYDLIAQMRLEHQVRQVRAAAQPDNFLAPSDLSDFDRSHLRDAFVVVKSLQAAVGHGKGMLG